jgi:hypothetical protein
MGTRGYIIIKFNNKYYAIYNPYDSYPSCLGQKVIEYLKTLIQKNELSDTEMCLNTIIEYFFEELKLEKYRIKIEEYSTIENYDVLDGEWFYIVDLKKMLLIIKGNGFYPYYIKYSLIKDNEFSIFNCMEE